MANSNTERAITVIMDSHVIDKYDALFLRAKKEARKRGKTLKKKTFASYFFSRLIPNINVSEFIETI